MLSNNGSDGYTTVELAVDGQIIESKFMAVSGGDFRVVQFATELSFDDNTDLTPPD